MLLTDIQEDSFVKKSSSSYDLSILVGVDRFFYAVLDAQQNLQVLRAYQFDAKSESFKTAFQHIFLNDKILQLPFSKTRLAFVNSLATLVPQRLFKDEYKADYLHHLIRLQEAHTVEVNPLDLFDAQLVYAIEETIVKAMHASFPNARFFHINTPFLLGCRRVMEHQHGHHIFLNIKEDLLQTALFDGAKLLFSNSFPFQSATDFIYFVMLIFDQFQLKPESTPVHLSGMIEKDSEIYQQLYRYIRHINFVQQPSFIRFGQQANTLNKYFYYDLFCLKLCE